MTGPGGTLKALTKTIFETALDAEMPDHLGYDKHHPSGPGSGNSRNEARTKTVLTESVGPVEIGVPRDSDGSFDPVIVKKRQRRLGGVDTIVLSLVANGLTTVRGHFPTEQAALKCLYRVTRSLDQGHRPAKMDHALEASAQRVRDHLRRPDAESREPLK